MEIPCRDGARSILQTGPEQVLPFCYTRIKNEKENLLTERITLCILELYLIGV